MSEEEEQITFESLGEDLLKGKLTRKISYFTIILSALIGSFLRIEMGHLDRLLALDPFEMYHLSRHWFEHWAPATFDQLLFPGPGGTLSGVGYPPLTHALPAMLTKFLNIIGIGVSLKQIVIIFPVLIGALLPLVYWFLGKELYNEKVGIVAAILTFIFPQFILVGVTGKYDTNIYIALFFPLVLGLFAKSFNENKVLSKIKWGMGAGTALGLFGLFWAGYTVLFATLGFSIIIYTAIATWIDKIKKEDTYSLLGILISYPILTFFHPFSSINGPLLVAPMIFLPYISAKLPDWSSKLSFVEDGYRFRKTLTAALSIIVFAGVYLVFTGIIPIQVSGMGLVKHSAIIHSTISELQPTYTSGSGIQPLVSSFGTLGIYVLPVLFLPQLYIFYKLYNNFTPTRLFEFVFVGFTFVMHFFASRFLPLYLLFVAPVVAAELVWAAKYIGGIDKIKESLDKTYVKLTSWDKFKALIVFAAIFLVLLTSLPVAAPLKGNFQTQQVPSVVYQESNGAWTSTFDYMDQSENITKEDCVLSWWDYGFAMKVLGDVTAFTDNTQHNAEEAAKYYTMLNLSEGKHYLTEYMEEDRGEDVDYVIGNKYLGYSGKWQAVVTVASGITDRPNLADGITRDEYPWIWAGSYKGNKTKQSNYYKLSFYNATKYGVGDSPYPGYEIVYQSPQWYIEYKPEGMQQMRLAIVNVSKVPFVPVDQRIGPAITLYKLTNTSTT